MLKIPTIDHVVAQKLYGTQSALQLAALLVRLAWCSLHSEVRLDDWFFSANARIFKRKKKM
jgi:hypothetical protein